jgi:N-acetyl-1-D-myo-inositol-2-amino-2-deoxy-alpha-D-glucopyranoside deacetylase
VETIKDIVGVRRTVNATPDVDVTDRVDVLPWLEQKVDAILANGSEVDRGGLPGLIARLSPMDRKRPLSTEWFIRRDLSASAER